MEIVLKNTKSKYLEIFSILDFDKINETFEKFSSIKGPIEAIIFAINESISSCYLSKLKKLFNKNNIYSLSIYSNRRDTILAGTALRIDSTFVQEQEAKKQ